MEYLYTREEVAAKLKEWRNSKSQLNTIRTILDDVLDILEAKSDVSNSSATEHGA